jgi:Tfp pilus assembly protein PilF
MLPTTLARTIGIGVIATAFVVLNPLRAQTPAAPNSVDSLLAESAQRLADGDYQGAISDASTALVLDPKNVAAYESRGSIYIQEKLWDRAERDYSEANKLKPDPVYQYKLGEIKFLQKSYEDAQPRFAALEKDPNLGQLAYYKAFLCDLLGGHDDAARHDLAVLNQAPEGPARAYSQAAYDIYHGQRAEAARLFKNAGELYGDSIRDLYVASLMETRRFQLDTVSFSTRDGTNYSGVNVFLESGGLRVSTSQGWITIPLNQLPDDLATFPEDLREQIDRRRAVQGAAVPPITFVSFTTQSGQTYTNVRWALDDSGLSVLTEDGWTSVPFKDLPADLSTFPADLQQQITEKRNARAAGPLEPGVVSFTTRQGKAYTDAQAQPGPEGLRVLTPNGWIVIAYADLPADVSPFPPDWQKSIAEKRREPATPSATEPGVLTFSTIHGKTYTSVHAELGVEGIRVLTAEGWLLVAYPDLPDDLSAFPPAWQPLIRESRTKAENDIVGMQVVSFTTRQGVRYDDVRATLDKSGMSLVTSKGLVGVPYSQLPTDLTPFPAPWREAITDRLAEVAKSKTVAP